MAFPRVTAGTALNNKTTGSASVAHLIWRQPAAPLPSVGHLTPSTLPQGHNGGMWHSKFREMKMEKSTGAENTDIRTKPQFSDLCRTQRNKLAEFEAFKHPTTNRKRRDSTFIKLTCRDRHILKQGLRSRHPL